jgi:hypothetical protein
MQHWVQQFIKVSMVQNPEDAIQTAGVREGRAEEDELDVEELSIDWEENDDSADEDVGDGVTEDDTTSALDDSVAEDDALENAVEDSSTDEELVTTDMVSPAEPVVQVVVMDDGTEDKEETGVLERVDTLLDEDTALQLPKPSWQPFPQ